MQLTERNEMDVPEVCCYSRQEIEGGVVIRYLVRQPGERDWQPVKLFVPEKPAPPRRRGDFLELMLPARK